MNVPQSDDVSMPGWMAELEAAGWRMPRKPGASRSVPGQPRIDPNKTYPEPDHPFVRVAFEKRLGDLSLMGQDSGRNSALNEAAVYLGGFPVGREQIRDQLLAACQTNGLLTDDGHRQCDATISSGFCEADRRPPHPIEERPGYTAQVVEVPQHLLDGSGPPPEPATGYEHIFDAEDDFWDRSTQLRRIYDSSMRRGASPWAVLAICLTRALMQIQPHHMLPPTIGGATGLNFFVALVAQSGGGKGVAGKVAAELVPGADLQVRNLGSGEGVTAQFWKPPAAKGDPPQIVTAILFNCDEVDGLAALGERSGSTLMAVIRSAFSGETLGFAYRSNDHHIAGDEYRLCLILSVQPKRAGALLEDSAGGTPQRIMWMPSTDHRIPEGRRPYAVIEPLEVASDCYRFQPDRKSFCPRLLVIPDIAADAIWDAHVARSRGAGDALDGHAMLCRVRAAQGFAAIHNEAAMSEAHWEMAGVMAEVSSRTRSWASEEMVRGERESSRRKGRQQGVAASSAESERAAENTRKSESMQSWIVEHLTAGGQTGGALRRVATSTARPWIQPALDALLRERVVTVTAGVYQMKED